MCANLAFYKDLLRSSEDILDGKLDVSFFFFAECWSKNPRMEPRITEKVIVIFASVFCDCFEK